MRTSIVVLVSLAFAMSLFPGADAHSAPAARAFETRIIHDHNDDSFIALAGKHGFDAIALDVREARMPATGQDALVLRLLLNGGCDPNLPADCPTMREVVQFANGETQHEITFASPDGATWSGDAPLILGPTLIGDGDRFAVEGWVPYSQLNLTVGDTLTDWFVRGFSGESEADHMPQGAAPGAPDPTGASIQLADYVLKPADFYLSVQAAADSFQVQHGSFAVDIGNLLPMDEAVLVTVVAPDGIAVEPANQTVKIAGNFTQQVAFTTTGLEPGAITVTATTPTGGHATATLFAVLPAAAVPNEMLAGPELAPGQSWAATFAEAGVFGYHDHNAPTIGGNITITAASGPRTVHTVAFNGAFEPEALTISAGDIVVWRNDADTATAPMGVLSLGHDDSDAEHDHGAHPDEHMEGDHAEPDDNDTPGVPVTLLLVALAFVAYRRR